MRSVFCCFLFACFAVAGCAEELLPKAQRELRARRFFFGEIDGRASSETTAAIGKFQVAKGLERSGHLDRETLRALGLVAADATDGETRRLQGCCEAVLRYWQARESGEWARVRGSYAATVNYLYDGVLDHAALHRLHAGEDRRWPRRQYTLLNRIASLAADGQAQVTARVRSEVSAGSGPAQARTEDLLFRLQLSGETWHITALKLLE